MSDFTIGAGTGENAFPPVDQLSYEQARAELIETVKILELGQMSLDESLRYWERGEALARVCEDFLEGARRRVDEVLAKRQGATETATEVSSGVDEFEDEDSEESPF